MADLNRLPSARFCRVAKYKKQQKMLKFSFIFEAAGILLGGRELDQVGNTRSAFAVTLAQSSELLVSVIIILVRL